MRLIPGHFMTAEDASFEILEDTDLRELHFDLVPIGTGCDGDDTAKRFVQRFDCQWCACHAEELGFERRIAPGAELLETAP